MGGQRRPRSGAGRPGRTDVGNNTRLPSMRRPRDRSSWRCALPCGSRRTPRASSRIARRPTAPEKVRHGTNLTSAGARPCSPDCCRVPSQASGPRPRLRIDAAQGGHPNPFDADLLGRNRTEFAQGDMPAPVRTRVFPIPRAVGRLLGRDRRYADAPPPGRRSALLVRQRPAGPKNHPGS